MLSLSPEYRALLLEKATKLYLSIGRRGYTSTICPILLPHEKLDSLNDPIFGTDGRNCHEIDFTEIDIDGRSAYRIVINNEWLDKATIEKPGDEPVALYSEFLIKDQQEHVLVRDRCTPVYVRDWDKFEQTIILS